VPNHGGPHRGSRRESDGPPPGQGGPFPLGSKNLTPSGEILVADNRKPRDLQLGVSRTPGDRLCPARGDALRPGVTVLPPMGRPCHGLRPGCLTRNPSLYVPLGTVAVLLTRRVVLPGPGRGLARAGVAVAARVLGVGLMPWGKTAAVLELRREVGVVAGGVVVQV